MQGELAKVPAVDPGLTAGEVQQIVKAAMAETAATLPEPDLTLAEVEEAIRAATEGMTTPEPGLTATEVEAVVEAALAGLPEQGLALARGDVEEAVRVAMAEMATSGPGLDRAEVERLARNAVVAIPPKSSPDKYTKFFVDNAIGRYEAEGLDAAVSHYNGVESVDGQWYVFILDDKGKVISHYDSHLIGEDLRGPLGTDANGYNFGQEMLSATEGGKWVSYVYKNPDAASISPANLSNVDLKNAHGWYATTVCFSAPVGTSTSTN